MLALHRDTNASPAGDEAPMLDRGVHTCPYLYANGHQAYVAITSLHSIAGHGDDPTPLWALLDQIDPESSAPMLAITIG